MKIIELHKSITASNDMDADALRAQMKEQGTLLINLMSSPGSGKTTLLSSTIQMLSEIKIAVLEADIESAVDAERIEQLGAVAVQVHTDGMCHMDAGMTKTGIMVGLGETQDEVLTTIHEAYLAGCRMLTIGQYLQPSSKQLDVQEYVHPDIFSLYKAKALEMGFANVESAPLVRSSYMAEESYVRMMLRKRAKTGS